MPTPEQLWQKYLESDSGALNSPQTYSSWHFCNDEKCANELLDLVLKGRKVATASSLWALELSNEHIPQEGDISIITNWNGDARCVVCTTRIDVIPFEEVSAEFARLEGEGDQSIKYWREVLWEYFSRELSEFGKQASTEMPIICERFRVLFKSFT